MGTRGAKLANSSGGWKSMQVVRGSTTSDTSDTIAVNDRDTMVNTSDTFAVNNSRVVGEVFKTSDRSTVMDEKRNEPGENPRKKSFRTLALVAQSLQPSAEEKQYSARLRSFHRLISLFYGVVLLASTFHLASGTVGIRQTREYFYFLGENFQSMLAVSIAAGTVLAINCVHGGLKAFRTNPHDIDNNGALVACVTLMFLLVGQGALMINGAVHLQNYEERLERRLTLGFADPDSMAVDNLQRGLLCCGVNGPSDWGEDLPAACCDPATVSQQFPLISSHLHKPSTAPSKIHSKDASPQTHPTAFSTTNLIPTSKAYTQNNLRQPPCVPPNRNQTGCLQPLVHIYYLYSALVTGGTGLLVILELVLLGAILMHEINN